MSHSPGQFISRAEWGARPPRDTTPLRNPGGNTAHWEGPGLGNYPQDQCAPKLRNIQNHHMNVNGWDDIAYSAVVCIHGAIFEGRWWGRRTAANGTNTGNNSSYAVCVMMGVGDVFTHEAQIGLRTAFDWSRSQGGAGGSNWVHHDWYATACPGGDVTAFVRAGLPAEGFVPPPGPQRPQPPKPGGTAPPFPYGSADYLGQPSSDPHCHSGYYGGIDQTNVRTWQTQMRARGWTIDTDGRYGPQSEDVCRKFQAEKGLGVDGLVGPRTWDASWTAPVT